MNKFPFLILLWIALLAIGCTQKQRENSVVETDKLKEGYVTLVFNYGEDRPSRSIDGLVWQEGMSVLDALDFAQNELDDFTFSLKKFEGMGSFVYSIDSLGGNNKKYWLFCVNGKPSNLGVNSKMIEPSDEIVWFYTSETNPCKN